MRENLQQRVWEDHHLEVLATLLELNQLSKNNLSVPRISLNLHPIFTINTDKRSKNEV